MVNFKQVSKKCIDLTDEEKAAMEADLNCYKYFLDKWEMTPSMQMEFDFCTGWEFMLGRVRDSDSKWMIPKGK